MSCTEAAPLVCPMSHTNSRNHAALCIVQGGSKLRVNGGGGRRGRSSARAQAAAAACSCSAAARQPGVVHNVILQATSTRAIGRSFRFKASAHAAERAVGLLFVFQAAVSMPY